MKPTYRVPSKISLYPGVFFIVAPILIALGLWMAFYAPCGWYSGPPVTEVPLRCLPALPGDR